MKMASKIGLPPKLFCPLPPHKKLPDIFWWHLTLTATRQQMSNRICYQANMLSGVQTGNRIPHDRYNIRGIAHAHTNKKDDIFMQRRPGQIFTCILEWGQRTCKKSRPYPARAYTTLVVLVSFEVFPKSFPKIFQRYNQNVNILSTLEHCYQKNDISLYPIRKHIWRP